MKNKEKDKLRRNVYLLMNHLTRAVSVYHIEAIGSGSPSEFKRVDDTTFEYQYEGKTYVLSVSMKE